MVQSFFRNLFTTTMIILHSEEERDGGQAEEEAEDSLLDSYNNWSSGSVRNKSGIYLFTCFIVIDWTHLELCQNWHECEMFASV